MRGGKLSSGHSIGSQISFKHPVITCFSSLAALFVLLIILRRNKLHAEQHNSGFR